MPLFSFRALLAPAPPPAHRFISRFTWIGVITLLGLSAALVFIAPLMMPAVYSPITHLIDESAAQGVPRAWITRLGFLLFGIAVVWLSLFCRPMWARGAYWAHLGVGILLVTIAVFSHRSWSDAFSYDVLEDILHNIALGVMWVAFVAGVLLRGLQHRRYEYHRKIFDRVIFALVVSLPLLAFVASDIKGLVERMIFLGAYAWYATEAWFLPRPSQRR